MTLEQTRAKIMLDEIQKLRERRRNAFSAYHAYVGNYKQQMNQNSARAAIEAEAYETECERIIRGIENEMYQKVLYLKYFECKSIPEIAGELFYSPNHIYKLHREALELNYSLRQTYRLYNAALAAFEKALIANGEILPR